MQVSGLDHLVLTVRDIARSVAFYRDVLGMEPVEFAAADGTVRWALRFGGQKINLHQAGAEFEPHAAAPGAGTADLCFESDAAPDAWLTHFDAHGVAVEEGPVGRSGARGPITSVYCRDPDGNLIEVSRYD